ncbi:MAG: metalloprotease [Thermoplasmata archaeon]|nr:metalloprotease [Thermoplasmata archaeon]
MTGAPYYTVRYAPVSRGPARLSTSAKEVGQLTLAFLVLSVAIAVLALGTFRLGVSYAVSQQEIAFALGFGAIAALTGFVAHELAHKIVAQRRGYSAEFQMFPVGLFLALVTAFVGFLFALPGATVVEDISDVRDFGRTSLAGPAVNLAEGGAFAAAAGLLSLAGPGGLWPEVLFPLAFFNGWFATFNLIPVGPLDGRKVLRWSRGIWAVGFGTAAAFTLFTYLLAFGVLSV